jgi:hypothetical protein
MCSQAEASLVDYANNSGAWIMSGTATLCLPDARSLCMTVKNEERTLAHLGSATSFGIGSYGLELDMGQPAPAVPSSRMLI